MPHYISLVNWTDQGIKHVRESPKRADAFKSLVENLGGTTQLFYTLGDHDLVAVTELPNDESAMQALLQIGMLGNVRTKTLKAMTPAEATKVIAKLKEP